MSNSVDVIKPYRKSFFIDLAQAAWDHFIKFGYPQKQDEKWKFSNPIPWLLPDATIVNKEEPFNPNMFSKEIIENTYPIFIFNDSIIYSKEISNKIKIFHSNNNSIDFEKYDIGKIIDYNSSSFVAENTALFQNVLCIDIEDGAIIDKPIQIIHLLQNSSSSRIYPRIFFNIGKNSESEIWNFEIGGDVNSHFINSVIEIVVNEHAKLEYSIIQNRNYETGQISSVNFGVEKNAMINCNFFEFGSGFLRRDINADLHNINAEFTFNSLFVSDKNQHKDISCVIKHENAYNSSCQLVKGILLDKSSGVFRGLSKVCNNANKTDAQQMNNNLLLSSNAKMNSIPQLEIDEDDVKCSHGSTTGKIDEDAIFYLRSRGINKEDSLRLMINGFANEVIDKIGENDLNNYLSELFLEKINTSLI